jgi:hypothetical protein
VARADLNGLPLKTDEDDAESLGIRLKFFDDVIILEISGSAPLKWLRERKARRDGRGFSMKD